TAKQGERSAAWSIAIAPAERIAWLDEARALRASGHLDEAAQRIAEGLAPPSRPEDRARALGLLARIERARGHRESAVSKLREALAADRSLGLVSDEANDSFALSYILAFEDHRYAEARAVLADARPALDRDPEERTKEPYYRAVIAMQTGDAREALRGL